MVLPDLGAVVLPVFTPDACVVIARLKTGDDNHDVVNKYLSQLRPCDVKILRAVYEEAMQTIGKLASDMLRSVSKAIQNVARRRGTCIDKLGPEYVDEVEKETIKISKGKHEGFYISVFQIMRSMCRTINPYKSLSIVVDMVKNQDEGMLRNLFYIKDSSKDCLSCTDEETAMKGSVGDFLKKSDQFFGERKHDMDLKIAVELITIGTRNEIDKLVFVTLDKEFYDVLSRVLKTTEHPFNVDKLSVELLCS